MEKNWSRITEFERRKTQSFIFQSPALRKKPRSPIFQGAYRLLLLSFLGWVQVAEVVAQATGPLQVEAKVAAGTYLVGQGIELRVGAVASQRPRIDLPRITGAVVWKIGVDARSISKTGIGSILAEESRFVVRYRVVAERAGTLEIPSIRAEAGGRAGHSQPIRVAIRAVPLTGRTADFLGGVGQFTLTAIASPKVVRAGQELDYRIKVSGPAAWGMNGHPELSRFGRLPLGLRIESKPDEMVEEPPERTFVYRLRPVRAGEAVLPPVAIAAFDPTLSRYVTRVTPSVPIRVVAVPAFDPTSIDGSGSKVNSAQSTLAAWVVAGVLLSGAAAALVWVRRRARRRPLIGPAAARRYAARLARSYGSIDPGVGDGSSIGVASNGDIGSVPADDAARRASEELMRYLEIGLGRPTGALTPEEAWHGVRDLTGCLDLASQAGRLAARCDQVLYGDLSGHGRRRQLRQSARMLFEALGRVRTGRARFL